jgi:hypothetical protein
MRWKHGRMFGLSGVLTRAEQRLVVNADTGCLDDFEEAEAVAVRERDHRFALINLHLPPRGRWRAT